MGLGLGALVALFALPGVAAAATYQVNTTADQAVDACLQPPAGDCTIRDAMNVGLTNQDVIRVPAGTYQLTVGELVHPNGTLQGAGARSTIIRAAPNSRVIRVGTEAFATISGVSLTGGAPVAAATAAQGGGIVVQTPRGWSSTTPRSSETPLIRAAVSTPPESPWRYPERLCRATRRSQAAVLASLSRRRPR